MISNSRPPRFLVALPVYNEASTVADVLDQVQQHADNILVVNDGSSDGTSAILAARDDIQLVEHDVNRGYGQALITAFDYAVEHDFDYLVTIDCDGQHQPERICRFVEMIQETGADIISGSRYLQKFDADTVPPEQRRKINSEITATLNKVLGFQLTDAFCGFKAYRVASLPKLELTETGYAMPLELWVQASCQKLTVQEVAVPLIYLDENRSFGGSLDDGATRLKYYHTVVNKALKRLPDDCETLRQQRVG